jgi:glycosyltransferase involved in cell wall biosynthesis
MADLSIVIPYYLNPEMLALQYKVWAGYPGYLKSNIEIVIVDDGSPVELAEKVRRPGGLPPLRIYRVLVDKPWNQHGARNLGAHEANGPWLFLTDMDHVLPSESLGKLIGNLAPDRIYTFARLNAPDMEPMRRPDGSLKEHPNTFAMTKEMYWRIGGYDERFCGIYGTDSLFRKRAASAAKFTHLHDVPIVRFSRDVIHDASTRTLPRKEGRGDSKKRLLRQIAAEGSEDRIETLTFPWERVV